MDKQISLELVDKPSPAKGNTDKEPVAEQKKVLNVYNEDGPDFERDLGMTPPQDSSLERTESPMQVASRESANMRMNSVQLNLSITNHLVPVVDKNQGAKSNSSRRLMKDAYKTSNDVFAEKSKASAAGDDMLETTSMLQSTVSQVFSRPVDAMRKSKVEQRQAKRESFRQRLNEEHKSSLLQTLTMKRE